MLGRSYSLVQAQKEQQEALQKQVKKEQEEKRQGRKAYQQKRQRQRVSMTKKNKFGQLCLNSQVEVLLEKISSSLASTE